MLSMTPAKVTWLGQPHRNLRLINKSSSPSFFFSIPSLPLDLYSSFSFITATCKNIIGMLTFVKLHLLEFVYAIRILFQGQDAHNLYNPFPIFLKRESRLLPLLKTECYKQNVICFSRLSYTRAMWK